MDIFILYVFTCGVSLRHHVHASGELQRVLRKETDSERKVQRKVSEVPEEQPEMKRTGTAGSRKPSLNGGQRAFKDVFSLERQMNRLKVESSIKVFKSRTY